MKMRWNQKLLACILCISISGCLAGHAAAQDQSSLKQNVSSDEQIIAQIDLSDFQSEGISLIEETVEEENVDDLEVNEIPEVEQGEIIIIPKEKNENQILSRATGTDLAISNMRAPNNTEPLPNMTDVKIVSTIQNLGSTTISGFNYSVYMDTQLLTTKSVAVTLGAGASANLNLNIKNRVGGSHTVMVTVWLPNGPTETNTSNNSVSKAFRWQDAVSVRAYEISGSSKIEPNVDHAYEISVANLGNLDGVDIPIKILLNGKMLDGTARASIPARKILNFAVNAKFENSGGTSLGIYIDPQHTSADIDPDDNQLSKSIQVLTPEQSWGGTWRNSDGISVQILDKVKDLVAKENFRISMDQIVSSIESWNGVASGVSFGEIWVSDTNDDVGKDIVLTKGSILGAGKNVLGITVTYDENGNEVDQDGGRLKDVFVHSRITLEQDHLLENSSAAQAQTVTHEFGHALGLRHPPCSDTAIMRESTATAAYRILEHDEQALQETYK
ncbi:CARDB domain-containing protein [Anaeromassilibacillus senegalensis]|uniref:CARDB domain-containing protein n=1 Tax=Anaeromassilibacillus senegalensis TaxID=1673717 RepID=UPI00068195AC|nr:CARDB domain-containing protein [Anaeromassilibacillus senegalensis]